MTRTFTQQEQEAFIAAEQQLRDRGIAVDGTDGDQNGGVVLDYFQRNPNVPVTVDTVLQVVNLAIDKLQFTSKQAKSFNQLQPSPEDLEQLQNFLSRKPLIGLDGTPEGFANAAILVEWCRSRNLVINFGSLESAMNAWIPGVGAAAGSSTKTLFWKERVQPERTHAPSGLRNHSLDKDEQSKDDGRVWKSGRLNHAAKSPQDKPAAPVLDPSEAKWKDLAQSKLKMGHSHSINQELQETYDSGSSGASWRKVNDQMAAILKRQAGR